MSQLQNQYRHKNNVPKNAKKDAPCWVDAPKDHSFSTNFSRPPEAPLLPSVHAAPILFLPTDATSDDARLAGSLPVFILSRFANLRPSPRLLDWRPSWNRLGCSLITL